MSDHHGNEKSTRIHIAAACDEAYAMPLAVMLRSLADNLGTGRSVVVHIMFDTLSPETRARLQASAPTDRLQIQWTSINHTGITSAFTPLRAYDHISPASYFRLLLPDVLPLELQRVIYLDCDLVVSADIGMLWDLDLDGHYAAAVPELTEDSHLVSSPQGIRLWRELGLSADLEQFNSGVLLINLDKWRTEFIRQRALIYLEQAADWLRWHDQEALNAIFAGDWLRLDAHWNLTMRWLMENVPVTYQPPCIIHYHSAEKPWHTGYPFAFRDLFLDYLDRTAWAGWRPEHPPLAPIRRIAKRLKKALNKRQHALRRLRNEITHRHQQSRLLASHSPLLDRSLPEKSSSGEIRVFMIADHCTPQARTLIEHYLVTGADRVVLAVNASAIDAWRSFANSNTRIHLVIQGTLSVDEILRIMLNKYGQGHWCLLTRADEWLRYPYDDRLTLIALTRYLDTQHCTALMSRRVELIDANNPDSLSMDFDLCLPDEVVRKLPMTERDMICNRIFIANSYVVPAHLGSASQSAFRSTVSLLKYAPDMLIGPDFRSAQGIHVPDVEGVMLQAENGAPSRIDWQVLETAGLLHSPEVFERIATLETNPP